MSKILLPALQTLSEPFRIRILHILLEGSFNVGAITTILQAPQSTVSRHLKILNDQNWIQKRTERTTSLFSFQPALLRPQIQNLWSLVQSESIDLAKEDIQKAKTILALRQIDSQAFFKKIGNQWSTLRKNLFGNQFLLPTLLNLVPSALSIADIGCGTGDSLCTLSPYVQQIIGVDQSNEMIQIARQRTKNLDNITIKKGSLGALPIEDNSVDAVLCILVLHHVSIIATALNDLHRILRPKGTLIVLDMCVHSFQEFQKTMGHQHLGFSVEAFQSPLFKKRSWVNLPKDKNALGPQLFTASFEAL